MNSTTSTTAPPPRGFQVARSLERTGRRTGEWRHISGVGALAAGLATLYALYLLTLHATLRDGMMDVAEFDQAISSYAHFTAPHSPFIGLGAVNGSGALQLSDHFTPLLALLAPFYWIRDGPETLLIETAILAALPVIPMWIFARRAFAPSSSGTCAAYLIALGYGLSWPLQMALAFEFHEVFLAMPVMAWMLERAQAGRLRQAALISLLLLGVKDDMGFVVAAFGAYLAAKDVTPGAWCRLAAAARTSPGAPLRAATRSGRWSYLAMIPIGLGMVALVNAVLLPMFGGSPTRNFTYSQFGRTPGRAMITMITHPALVGYTIVDPPTKLATLAMLLCPVLALCLLSPITLLVTPLLLERFLSTNNLYWGMALHYNAFLIPILFCGGIDGAARLTRALAARKAARAAPDRDSRGSLPLLLATWSVAFGLITPFPMHEMITPSFWNTSTSEITAARTALSHIPAGTLVAAADSLGPQLLSRDQVIMWTSPGDRDYPDAPWVLADIRRPSPPFPSVAAQATDVRLLLSKGYQPVFQDDGFIVLHKG